MSWRQGNPGRGAAPRRGADTHAPDPPPTGRPSYVSPVALMLAAVAGLVAVYALSPGAPPVGPWRTAGVLLALAVVVETGTALSVRRHRARVAAIVARRVETSRDLPWFG